MRKHMTHFDDCGCLTATHQQELDAARGMMSEALYYLDNLKIYTDDRRDEGLDQPLNEPEYKELVGLIAKASEFLKADGNGGAK